MKHVRPMTVAPAQQDFIDLGPFTTFLVWAGSIIAFFKGF